MKKIVLFATALMLSATMMAQNVESTTLQVGTVTAQGYTLRLSQDEKTVRNALEQRLKDARLKTKKVDGYTACIDQLCADIASVPVNLYTKVEEQGHRKDRYTVVTLCVIPSDLTVNQADVQAGAQRFLSDFASYVTRHEARGQMEKEQDNLKKVQKKQASAVAAVTKINKSIASDQEKIADRKKDIEKYNQKIKECQEDIKKLEASIAKSQEELKGAEANVKAADETVRSAQSEVDKYRSIAE